MKKITAISTLAFGIVLLISTTANAMNTIPVADFILKSNAEMIIESEISVKDWMISPVALAGSSSIEEEMVLNVESWMVESNWNDTSSKYYYDVEIALEDWMIKVTTQQVYSYVCLK